MKKHFFIILMLLFLFPITFYAKNADDSSQTIDERNENNSKELKNKKMSDMVELKVKLETKAEVGLVDTNDTNEVNIGIAKNKPKFNTNATVFAKILSKKYQNLIIGPVGNTEIEGDMDHHKVMTSATKSREIFYFEKGDFFNYAGLKLGTKFGKQYFADSSFTITIPFLFEFQVNDSNDAGATIADSPVDYYSHLLLGTNIIADLELKSKPLHLGFDIKNTLKIAGDVCSLNTKEAFQYLFLTSKNEFAFHIKPFNFINNKVDVEFKGYFRAFAEFTGDNLQVKKRVYFAISWDGLKNFGLRYKPIIYNDESNYQFVDVSRYSSYSDFLSYYNYYNFSTEFAIFFGNKYFNIEISYELPYYTIDDSSINEDSVREHTITTAIEVKF